MQIVVLGAGAWGQALALHLDRCGHAVTLGARTPDGLLDAEQRSRRLGGQLWSRSVGIAPLEAAALQAATAAMVVLATPTIGLAGALLSLPARTATPLLLCSKGFAADTAELAPELAARLRPGHPTAVLTGPNFADEVARGLPAASVLAAADGVLARTMACMVNGERFRIYPSDDPLGAAIGGAAKNVIAIGAGVAIGARLGENARAAIMTRGLAEIARLARALGGKAETLAGLAGAGDLMLTGSSGRSRNFRAGVALGEGQAVAATIGSAGELAEGVATAPSLLLRAKRVGVDLPVSAVIADLIDRRVGLAEAIRTLLARAPAAGETD